MSRPRRQDSGDRMKIKISNLQKLVLKVAWWKAWPLWPNGSRLRRWKRCKVPACWHLPGLESGNTNTFWLILTTRCGEIYRKTGKSTCQKKRKGPALWKYHCAQKDVRLITASSRQKTSVKSERGPVPRVTKVVKRSTWKRTACELRRCAPCVWVSQLLCVMTILERVWSF